jgi:[ribosomal protein S5]-alanine N-acetyltransferase
VTRNMAESWDLCPTFAIVLGDTVIGTVNFDINPPHQIAMLGFAIDRLYWGRGIGAEATRAAVAWAFEEFGLAKIWATTDVRNTRSRHLLEKLGMKCEGVFRSHELARDGRTDKIFYGLLHVPPAHVVCVQRRQ